MVECDEQLCGDSSFGSDIFEWKHQCEGGRGDSYVGAYVDWNGFVVLDKSCSAEWSVSVVVSGCVVWSGDGCECDENVHDNGDEWFDDVSVHVEHWCE